MTKQPLTNFPVSRPWSAHWIWHPHAPEKNAYVLFRNEFELAEPDNARLFISADTRYRVWVNGHALGDGPPQSQPYHQYYDERALASVMRKGTNCVAVLVHHQGIQSGARGGLLAEVVNGAGEIVSASDQSWRAQIGSAWSRNTLFTGMNKIGPFQEHLDLRRFPTGWSESGFDDNDWDAPQVVSRGEVTSAMPWCRLIPRDIEFLHEAPTLPTALQTVEECVDLNARARAGDLSCSLSQVGRPVDWVTVENVEALLSEDGVTRLACSDRHRDGVTDGRYDPCLTLDFGRVLTGYAEVEVEAPAGACIEIGYAERLIDERFNISLECPFGDGVTFTEGHNCFRPLIWRSFRYLRVRLKNCETGLRLKAVRAIEATYPYTPRGAYRGDERLEKIFGICRTTIELCSLESLMDTPYREQAQWLGDVAAVTVPGIFACFGDTALPGKFLRQAGMNTRPTGLLANLSNIATTGWGHDIPDYSLWWVMALWKFYQYTGDERYLHELYPEMQRVMRSHLEKVGPDGLIGQMLGWVFIDWAHVDKRGACAAYNALFAGACDAAAEVARVKSDTWAESVYRSAAEGVRAAFAATFLDPETGLVIDAVKDGTPSTRRSEQSNMAAIAYGCVDHDVADRIIEALFSNRPEGVVEAQPFFMVVVLDALRQRGQTDLALRLIDERWGRRMLDRGYTSCTEEWYHNGSWRDGDWQGFQRTHSHAWSACPTLFLTASLAGIEIIEPGCTRLRIRPHKAATPYEVVYPTPQGDVRVCWDGSSVRIDAPEGVAVEE